MGGPKFKFLIIVIVYMLVYHPAALSKIINDGIVLINSKIWLAVNEFKHSDFIKGLEYKKCDGQKVLSLNDEVRNEQKPSYAGDSETDFNEIVKSKYREARENARKKVREKIDDARGKLNEKINGKIDRYKEKFGEKINNFLKR